MTQIDIIIEWACLLVGLLCLRKWTPLPVVVILADILVTVINETWVAPYVHFFPYYNKNTSYNIYTFVDMGAWLYLFYRLFPRERRWWVLGAAVVLYAYSILELCWIRNWTTLHTDSYRLYEVVVILMACSYLFRLARKEYHHLWSDPYFWLCVACVFYHCVLFLNLTTMTESRYWFFRDARRVFYLLQGVSNILYYLLISVAFVICSNYQRMSTQASLRP